MTFSLAALAGEGTLSDGREISQEEAQRIMVAVPEVRWGLFLPGAWTGAPDFRPLLLPDVTFIQTLYTRVREVTELTHLEVVAWDIPADYDEDPGWTQANLEEACQAGAERCVVHVYPTLRDGWAQALEPAAPLHELREPDIRRLARRFSVLIEADFRREHLFTLPSNAYSGVNFTLSPWHRSFREVVELLTAYP